MGEQLKVMAELISPYLAGQQEMVPELTISQGEKVPSPAQHAEPPLTQPKILKVTEDQFNKMGKHFSDKGRNIK